MKLRNIFLTGLAAVSLAACSDYLEVDAPSKNSPDYVFSQKLEMERALNGVYTGLISSNTFGNLIFTSFQLNSDVDFASNSSASTSSGNFRRFDCDADAGNLTKAWSTLYEGIETANLFIEGIEGSPLYDAEDPDLEIAQMLGEAKIIRAIYYHELIWMFGDVPFSFNSTKTSKVNIYPIIDRLEIIDKLIADIKGIADKMQLSSEATVERPNRQMAYAMIARLAMTAGGYTLRPDGDTFGKMERMSGDRYKEYYKIARDAANEVINGSMAGTHSLSKDYWRVFYDECNFIVDNRDDVIFEIPFAKNSSGDIGYINGVTMKNYDGETATHNFGKADAGKAALNAFYRFMFDEKDARRDYINQLFYYDATATTNLARCSSGYTVNNGKWSKLWNQGGLGSRTEGSTGINYPYMRYTDVLLMFAEAENELNDGPTGEAMAALEQVRTRAFRSTDASKITDYPKGSKEEFLKAVLDERKFEFAGENMRWRDLVRNNIYNLYTYYNFWRYYAVADAQEGTGSFCGAVSEFDFGPGEDEHWDYLPETLYRVEDTPNEVTDESGTVIDRLIPESAFPANTTMKVVRILNPYKLMTEPEANAMGYKDMAKTALFSDWSSDNTIKNEVRYSLLGYIYLDENENFWIVKGPNNQRETAVAPSVDVTAESLPVLRYILPIPNTVIRRSSGQYVNKYGYK